MNCWSIQPTIACYYELIPQAFIIVTILKYWCLKKRIFLSSYLVYLSTPFIFHTKVVPSLSWTVMTSSQSIFLCGQHWFQTVWTTYIELNLVTEITEFKIYKRIMVSKLDSLKPNNPPNATHSAQMVQDALCAASPSSGAFLAAAWCLHLLFFSMSFCSYCIFKCSLC